ncbi:hypothetical protein JOC47_001922 [Halanaerobacter jeridensis]|uniref:Uncharacterized protein n=1 Tax=Halanaerobacter jeridensis TaxID=706427 RepID=A0A938XPJ3_9FIRM|nr:hypothetical protein [Halanaerobacter jeridensis]
MMYEDNMQKIINSGLTGDLNLDNFTVSIKIELSYNSSRGDKISRSIGLKLDKSQNKQEGVNSCWLF